ncbi:MAG: class I SAM-dependent methyltransferase [Parasphingopyxis sp.]|uniref:class I SAM-dependent methyltransferase n=1 Tax=Parasphingopyxis sp. TaxID=1920299 RepID=UPI003F9FB4ED
MIDPRKAYEDTETPFTPALGTAEHTSDYDRVIAVMTRERKWRRRMLEELLPRDGQTIVDLGAGTGTFAIMVKRFEPDARVIAIDPDPEVLAIAESKAAGLDIVFEEVMGDLPPSSVDCGTVDMVTSSLVLHQCPMAMKKGILANAFCLLKPGGRFLISDYGEQRDLLMHILFKQVRELDGYENTKANKDGLLPQLIEEAGFVDVAERYVTKTPTGSISLYTASKPD